MNEKAALGDISNPFILIFAKIAGAVFLFKNCFLPCMARGRSLVTDLRGL